MIPPIDLSPVRSAVFSEDRKYRYLLFRRQMNSGDKLLVYIGENASSADEERDDPTVARLNFRAFISGYSGLILINLAAAVASTQKKLKQIENPIGPLNDEYIEAALTLTGGVALIGWGQLIKEHEFLQKQAEKVMKMVKKPLCLGKTQEGYPRHPLYVAYNVPIQNF